MTNLKMASRTSCTVVLVGDAKTGKSALIRRLVAGAYAEVSDWSELALRKVIIRPFQMSFRRA